MSDVEISSYHFIKWDLGGTHDTPGEFRAHAYLLILSGIAAGNWYGNEAGWSKYSVQFDVPFPNGFAMFLRYWAPSIALASVGSDAPQNSSGWAVDSFGLVNPDNAHAVSSVRLGCDLAARNEFGAVWRLAFNVQIVGYR